MTNNDLNFLIEKTILKILQEEKEYPRVKMNWVEGNNMILGTQPFFERAMQFLNNKEKQIDEESNKIYNTVESNHRNTTKITFKTNEAAQKAKKYFAKNLGIIFDKE